jgi:hypothetical protein
MPPIFYKRTREMPLIPSSMRPRSMKEESFLPFQAQAISDFSESKDSLTYLSNLAY